jgi:transcription elongation factor Elf1
MENIELKAPLKCLFCGSPLVKQEGVEFNSGDLIKCNKCGESNDYDSVLEVAKEEGLASMKDVLYEQLQIQSKFKDLFK